MLSSIQYKFPTISHSTAIYIDLIRFDLLGLGVNESSQYKNILFHNNRNTICL